MNQNQKKTISLREHNFVQALLTRAELFTQKFRENPLPDRQKRNATTRNIDIIVKGLINEILPYIKDLPKSLRTAFQDRILSLEKALSEINRKNRKLNTHHRDAIISQTHFAVSKARVTMAIKHFKHNKLEEALQLLKAIQQEHNKETNILDMFHPTDTDLTTLYHLAITYRELNFHNESRATFRKLLRVFPRTDFQKLIHDQTIVELRKTLHEEATTSQVTGKSRESNALLKYYTIIEKDKMGNFTTYFNMAMLMAHLDILKTNDLFKTEIGNPHDFRWDYRESFEDHLTAIKIKAPEKKRKRLVLEDTKKRYDLGMPWEVWIKIKNRITHPKQAAHQDIPFTAIEALTKSEELANSETNPELKAYYQSILKRIAPLLKNKTTLTLEEKEQLPWLGFNQPPLSHILTPPEKKRKTGPISDDAHHPSGHNIRRSPHPQQEPPAESTKMDIDPPKLTALPKLSLTFAQRIKIVEITRPLQSQDGTTKEIKAPCIFIAKPPKDPRFDDKLKEIEATCKKFGFSPFDPDIIRTYVTLGNYLVPNTLDFDIFAYISILLFENDNEVDGSNESKPSNLKRIFEILNKGDQAPEEKANPLLNLAQHIHESMMKVDDEIAYWEPGLKALIAQKKANNLQKELREKAIYEGVSLEEYHKIRFDESGVNFLLIFASLYMAKQTGHKLNHKVFEHPLIKILFKITNDLVSKLNDLDSEDKQQEEVKGEAEPWSEPYQRFVLLTLKKHKLEKMNYNPFIDGTDPKDTDLFQQAFKETAAGQNTGFNTISTLLENFCFQLSESDGSPKTDIEGASEQDIQICIQALYCMLLLNHWGASKKHNARYHERNKREKEEASPPVSPKRTKVT